MPLARHADPAAGPWRRLLIASLIAMLPWAVLAQPNDGDTGGPNWGSLDAQQRSVLAPLGKDWNQLPAENRYKWMEVASRFPRMSPEQQQRIQQRMGEWTHMSPQQRSAARQNYQQSKQLSPQDRQSRWDAYRALSDEERQELANRARPQAGNSPATGARSLRAAPLDAEVPKSNLVSPTPRPEPRALSPSIVQGGAGATTSLVNRRPVPPAHQQAGRPKINAGPDQVDRATLLPKRGGGAGASAPQGNGPRNNGGRPSQRSQ